MARNTPNLALRVWDGLMDLFNHSELASNWDKLDVHDHTGGGKGIPIPLGGIAPGAVGSPELQDNSVQTAKIQNSAVTELKIGPQAVATGRIKDDAVTDVKLATNSVITSKVANNAVTDAKLSTKFIRARVNADATLTGSGLTATNPVTGSYVITFTTPFTATPLVFAQPVVTDPSIKDIVATVISVNTMGAEILLRRTEGGTDVDNAFNFLAITAP
jgi:hypothetical protein